MAAIKTPLVPIRMTAAAPTAARTHVRILQHELVMDEPEARHGTDLGPSPLDTLVASLAGCTNVLLNKIAAENGIEVHDLDMELSSDLNVRGILGIENIDRPLERIELAIRFSTSAPEDKIEILKSRLSERCAVSVIFRQAGIEIDYRWHILRR